MNDNFEPIGNAPAVPNTPSVSDIPEIPNVSDVPDVPAPDTLKTSDTPEPVEDSDTSKPVKEPKPPKPAGEQNALAKLWSNAIVRTTVILFLISAISAFALAAVNRGTAAIIAENTNKAVQKALGEVLPDMTEFTLYSGFEPKGTVSALYLASNSSGGTGYAVQVAPQGYGGAIDMIVGISSEGTVTGVSIVKMNETPELGTKTKDADFINQFIGKKVGVSIGKGENNIDAITGATISSRAVTDGVAEALSAVAAYMAEGVVVQ